MCREQEPINYIFDWIMPFESLSREIMSACNSETPWDIFTKLGTNIIHSQTMCRVQRTSTYGGWGVHIVFSSPVRKYRELLLLLWHELWCWHHTLSFTSKFFYVMGHGTVRRASSHSCLSFINRVYSLIAKPFKIFSQNLVQSDDVHRSTITPTTFLTELFPFENLSRVSTQ